MRILLGGLNQEVNSFSPGKTTIEEYKRKQYLLGDALIKAASEHVRAFSDLFDAMGGASTCDYSFLGHSMRFLFTSLLYIKSLITVSITFIHFVYLACLVYNRRRRLPEGRAGHGRR